MSPFSLIDISLPTIVFFTAPSLPSQHLTMLHGVIADVIYVLGYILVTHIFF